MEERNRVLLETIKTLIKRADLTKVLTVLKKVHPADVAEVAESLPFEERIKIIEDWEPEKAAGALLGMGEDEQAEIVAEIPVRTLAGILETMAADDVADVVGLAVPEKQGQVIEELEPDTASKVKLLLKYGSETAGGIMTPEFVALKKDLSADKAIEVLRRTVPKDESIYYVYVTNDEGQLVGVVSLRDLIIGNPGTLIKDVMDSEVVYARADLDQEEVARLMSKYDLLSLPVVNEDQHLLGIVTIDDVVDVIEEEATEDIYRLSGTRDLPASDVMSGRFWAVVRARTPWLMVALVGEVLIVGFIADKFTGLISILPALTVYWAAMTSIGGNTSFQASTVAVRALAIGELDPKTVGLRLFREARLGLMMSLVSAAALFAVALLWQKLFVLALIVAISNVTIVIVGALVGAVAPIVLSRAGVDPAVSSSPFLALIMDAVSLLLYFSVAVGVLDSYNML